MKHLKIFENFINELFRHGDMDSSDDDGKTVVQFKSDMWVFDEDSYEEYQEELTSKLGIKYADDYHSFIQAVGDSKPYILVGTIDKPYLNIIARNSYRHSKASTDLQKVMKAFNLTDVRTEYADVVQGDQDMYTFEKPVKPHELANTIFYHGTSVKFIRGIITKGLAPRDISKSDGNYGDIEHYDKVFITLNRERAYTHAMNSARKNDSYPVLIELRVPDVKKLSLDYDVAIEFMKDDDRTEELGYNKIADYIGHTGGNLAIPNINDKFGVYSYLGRIPASLIVRTRMETYTYPHYLMAQHMGEGFKIADYDGENEENIGHDVDAWREMSLRELSDYLVKAQTDADTEYHEYNAENDDDDDEEDDEDDYNEEDDDEEESENDY